MDGRNFDDLARTLAKGASRRSLLKALFGGAGAGALVAAGVSKQIAGAQNTCDPNADTITCPAGSFHEGLTKKPDGGCCPAQGNGVCCSNNCVDGLCVAQVVATTTTAAPTTTTSAPGGTTTTSSPGGTTTTSAPDDIDTLPQTGVGDGSNASGLLGITLAGGAAAIVAAKALRQRPETEEAPDA
jgi:LPXTG-motif cell wall-anchored protein